MHGIPLHDVLDVALALVVVLLAIAGKVLPYCQRVRANGALELVANALLALPLLGRLPLAGAVLRALATPPGARMLVVGELESRAAGPYRTPDGAPELPAQSPSPRVPQSPGPLLGILAGLAAFGIVTACIPPRRPLTPAEARAIACAQKAAGSVLATTVAHLVAAALGGSISSRDGWIDYGRKLGAEVGPDVLGCALDLATDAISRSLADASSPASAAAQPAVEEHRIGFLPPSGAHAGPDGASSGAEQPGRVAVAAPPAARAIEDLRWLRDHPNAWRAPAPSHDAGASHSR